MSRKAEFGSRGLLFVGVSIHIPLQMRPGGREANCAMRMGTDSRETRAQIR